MKSIILFLFIMGVIFITNAHQNKAMKEFKQDKIIEYRFIPRSIYDEQLGNPHITQSFSDMFETQNVYATSPYIR